MCGIAGFTFDDRSHTEASSIIEAMCASIYRRGPDSQGILLRRGLAIGMRRLSIIDLESGDQPLYNEDHSIVLVCNGEIYNSPELRLILEGLGHTFRTRSDCESIVHAYEQWGESCVERLNGMFAFALWDDSRRQLLLGRDRAGIKPLHYAQVKGGLVFASELKALLQHPDTTRQLNLNAVADFFAYEYVPTPDSIFEGIHKLPPGCILTHSPEGRTSVRQYWDLHLSDGPTGGRKSARGLAEELRHVLETAVRSELISDVPVGVLLSGGIDSSTVAALMARASSSQVPSFSIGFEDPSFDESRFARIAAQHIGTDHHELVLRPRDLWELVPRVGEFMDEPMGDSSIIPTYLLSDFVRRQVKVVLGGDGGDEVFAGYPTLQAHKAARYLRRLPGGVQALSRWMVGRLPVSQDNISFDFKAKRFLAGLPHPPAVRHQLWLGSVSHDQAIRLLSEDARTQLRPGRPYLQACAHQEASRCQNDLNQILYTDFKLYLENDILVKVDRASMACSLEVRVPLLNAVVVEFARQIPPDLKLHGLTSKYLLKEAVKDLLPPEIINRKKKGFNIPVARWFAGELKPLLLETLDPARLRQDGILDVPSVQRLMQEHFSQQRDNRKPLWNLLVFQQWYDRWVRTSSRRGLINAA